MKVTVTVPGRGHRLPTRDEEGSGHSTRAPAGRACKHARVRVVPSQHPASPARREQHGAALHLRGPELRGEPRTDGAHTAREGLDCPQTRCPDAERVVLC